MGVKLTHAGAVGGYHVPEMRATVLPGCGHCGAPHPLARKPAPTDSSMCPDCGMPAAATWSRSADAEITGRHPLAVIARCCFRAAEALVSLARRIERNG